MRSTQDESILVQQDLTAFETVVNTLAEFNKAIGKDEITNLSQLIQQYNDLVAKLSKYPLLNSNATYRNKFRELRQIFTVKQVKDLQAQIDQQQPKSQPVATNVETVIAQSIQQVQTTIPDADLSDIAQAVEMEPKDIKKANVSRIRKLSNVAQTLLKNMQDKISTGEVSYVTIYAPGPNNSFIASHINIPDLLASPYQTLESVMGPLADQFASSKQIFIRLTSPEQVEAFMSISGLSLPSSVSLDEILDSALSSADTKVSSTNRIESGVLDESALEGILTVALESISQLSTKDGSASVPEAVATSTKPKKTLTSSEQDLLRLKTLVNLIKHFAKKDVIVAPEQGTQVRGFLKELVVLSAELQQFYRPIDQKNEAKKVLGQLTKAEKTEVKKKAGVASKKERKAAYSAGVKAERERLEKIRPLPVDAAKLANAKRMFDTMLQEVTNIIGYLDKKGAKADYPELKGIAQTLHDELEVQGNLFFGHETQETFNAFTLNCATAYIKAEEKFKEHKHQGFWHAHVPSAIKIFLGVIMALTVIPGLVAAVAVGGYEGYKDTFFKTPPTKSLQAVQKLENLLESIEGELKIAPSSR